MINRQTDIPEEIYSDELLCFMVCEKHIAYEHFQKYKQGTPHMVESLILSDQMQLNPANRINNLIP